MINFQNNNKFKKKIRIIQMILRKELNNNNKYLNNYLIKKKNKQLSKPNSLKFHIHKKSLSPLL